MQRLEARFRAAALGASLLDHRERLAPLKLGALFQALEALRQQSDGLEPPTWPRDPLAMEELIATARRSAIDTVEKSRNDATRPSPSGAVCRTNWPIWSRAATRPAPAR
ncbi:hypothetical protein ACFSUK_13115 [Sphingobium scionense]